MKTKILKKASLTSIQLIILLFTIAYGVSVFASTTPPANHDQTKAVKSGKADYMLLAKGQAYVPPKDKSKSCPKS